MAHAIQPRPKRKIQFKCKIGEPANKSPRKTRQQQIAEAFFAVTGQEISEEEVSLIQDIQLPGDEVDGQAEDVETSEGENTKM